jgi:hypothetical protein
MKPFYSTTEEAKALAKKLHGLFWDFSELKKKTEKLAQPKTN